MQNRDLPRRPSWRLCFGDLAPVEEVVPEGKDEDDVDAKPDPPPAGFGEALGEVDQYSGNVEKEVGENDRKQREARPAAARQDVHDTDGDERRAFAAGEQPCGRARLSQLKTEDRLVRLERQNQPEQ